MPPVNAVGYRQVLVTKIIIRTLFRGRRGRFRVASIGLWVQSVPTYRDDRTKAAIPLYMELS